MGSTSAMPSQQRVTARTILFTSIGSWAPERFVTLMGTSAEGGGFRLNPGCWGAASATAEFDEGVLLDVGECMAMFLRATKSRRWIATTEWGYAGAQTRSSRPPLPRELRNRTASLQGCRSRQVFGLTGARPLPAGS